MFSNGRRWGRCRNVSTVGGAHTYSVECTQHGQACSRRILLRPPAVTVATLTAWLCDAHKYVDACAHLQALDELELGHARQAVETIWLHGTKFTRLRAGGEFNSLELECNACKSRRRCKHVGLGLEETGRRLLAWRDACPAHGAVGFGGPLLIHFA